jgi:hypothetical protein
MNTNEVKLPRVTQNCMRTVASFRTWRGWAMLCCSGLDPSITYKTPTSVNVILQLQPRILNSFHPYTTDYGPANSWSRGESLPVRRITSTRHIGIRPKEPGKKPAENSYFTCGADRGRTGDLFVANEALSQLSYSPLRFQT